LGPKLGKNCTNLAKKLLPEGHLTIIMGSLVVRINGCQSQIKPPQADKGIRKWFLQE
jgi:hypothetical protein